MSPMDLAKIKLPTGGGKNWEIPGAASAPTFDAIVAMQQKVRAFWPGEFAGNTPPQCASVDGVTGEGDPGGACAACPHSDFKGGCPPKVRLFLLLPESILPTMLVLPVTSVRTWRRHMVDVSNMRKLFYAVVTRFGLEPAKNPDGVPYSIATFSVAGMVSPEELPRVREYAKALLPLRGVKPTVDEMAGEGVEL